MVFCAISLFLSIFPVGYHESDSYMSPEVTGCANGKYVEWISVHDHALYIGTKTEEIRIPLPPVKNPLELWLSYDLQSNRVAMGEWGIIMVDRGPKDPI